MAPQLPNELPQLVIDQLPDALIVSDVEGTIREWNTAAERIFGFPREEAIGANLDIIIPERFREAHWRGFEQALANKKTKHHGESLATRSHKKDGTQIVVELSFGIVIADGDAIGATATGRDITERFEKDRADRRRLRELEAKSAE